MLDEADGVVLRLASRVRRLAAETQDGEIQAPQRTDLDSS